MNALALMATLGLDSSEYEKGLGESKKSANSFAKSIAKILGGIAIGAAVKKTLDGITAITKGAVNAYASFEQLAGGIETLFGNGGKSFDEYAKTASDSMYKMGQRGEDVLKLQKELIAAGYDLGEAGADGIYGPKTKAALDAYAQAGGQMVRDAYANTEKAQQIVMENADKAFMTAGLSANEYMETVTSFSASLIQSLGGDTEKAAHLSDQAILDMADNANKMGSDMGSIQTAYAGFAKQNYTMLDNLKLGYGGTKTEMERLIKDANDLRKAQGLNADLTIESYADVIEAIHTVQENMGITGTTAKEAEHTIQGSLNSTKAAWQNLLTALGSGKDVKKAMGNLTKSARHVVTNVVPVVKNALTGIGEMVQELGPVIIEELPGIIEDLFPTLLSAAGSLITAFARALPGILSAVWSSARTALGTFGAWLAEQSPVLGSLFDGLSSVIDRISEDIEALVSGEKNVGEIIIGWFTDAKEKIGEINWAEVGTNIKTKILDGIKWISSNVQGFFNDAKRLIKEINWAEVGQFILDAVSGILGGAAEALKKLFEDGKTSIESINWAEVGTNIWNAIKSAFNGIWAAFGRIFFNAKDGAENGPDWEGLGLRIKDLIVAGLKGIGLAISTLLSEAIRDITGIDIDAEKIWATLAPVIEGLTQLIENFVYGMRELQSISGGLWNGVAAIIRDAAVIIKGAIDGCELAIEDFVAGARWLNEIIGSIWEGVKKVTEDAWNAIITPIQKAIDAIKEFLGLNNDSGIVGNPDLNNKYKGLPGGEFAGSGGGRIKHASAMRNGEILRGITPFGFDQAGNVHYGGEAGAEAVVGVNSLRDMVHEAARNAIGGLHLQVVLDSGVLVGEIAPAMDEQLNDLATWKEGGRA